MNLVGPILQEKDIELNTYYNKSQRKNEQNRTDIQNTNTTDCNTIKIQIYKQTKTQT